MPSTITSSFPAPVTPYSFVNIAISNIDSNLDQIQLPSNHNFVTGNFVWFTYSTNALNFANIPTFTKLYVIVVSSTIIKIATTYLNAVSGISLDITSTTSLTGTFSVYKYYTFYDTPLLVIKEFPSICTMSHSFNTSIPFEINFDILSNYNLLSVAEDPTMLSTARHAGLAIIFDGGGQKFMLYLAKGIVGGGSNFYYYTSGGGPMQTASSNFYNTSIISTISFKIALNSSRQFQLYAGLINNPLTLNYTTSSYSNNTPLSGIVCSNFPGFTLSNCTIKYL